MAVHNFKMIMEFWNLRFNEFQRHMMRQVPDHGAKIQADPSRSKRCRPVPSPAKAETIDVCCLLCELAAKWGSLGESVESIESVESVVRTSWNAKIMKTPGSESTHDATWPVHGEWRGIGASTTAESCIEFLCMNVITYNYCEYWWILYRWVWFCALHCEITVRGDLWKNSNVYSYVLIQ